MLTAPRTVTLKGTTFELAPELPADLSPQAFAARFTSPDAAGQAHMEAFERLLGHDGFDRFLLMAEEGIVTPDDAMRFMERIYNAYGFFPTGRVIFE